MRGRRGVVLVLVSTLLVLLMASATLFIRLRVTEPGLDLNLPDVPQDGGVGRAVRTLNLLGQAIAASVGGPDPVAGRGALILARRVALGGAFRSVGELRAAEGGPIDEPSFLRLRPYLSVSGRPDPDTVTPVLDAGGVFTGLAVQPRVPVSLRSAPRALLAASLVLSGSGPKATAFVAADIIPTKVVRYILPTPTVAAAVPMATALLLADAILARRAVNPFDSWQEFHDWCDTLPAGITAEQADLIKANANPSALLNKYLPDRVALRRFDKTDVREPTTEFSLQGTGLYEIVSAGTMRGREGAVLAGARVECVARLHDIRTWTNQAQFEGAGRVLSLVSTLPEPMGLPAPPAASRWDGQVMLGRSIDRVEEARQTLRLDFTGGLSGVDRGAGTELPVFQEPAPDAQVGGPSVFNTAATGQAYFSSCRLHPGAGLSGPWKQRAEAGNNPVWNEFSFDGPSNLSFGGPMSVELWLKPVWNRTEPLTFQEDLFHGRVWSVLDNRYSAARIRLLRFGSDIALHITGQNAAGVVLTPVWRFPLAALPAGWDQSGRWHHVLISLIPAGAEVDVSLFVDGNLSLDSPRPIETLMLTGPVTNGGMNWDPTRYILDVSVFTGDVAIQPVCGSLGRVVVADAAPRAGYATAGFSPNSLYEESDVTQVVPPAMPTGLAAYTTPPVLMPVGTVLRSVYGSAYVPVGSGVRLSVDRGDGTYSHVWQWVAPGRWAWMDAASGVEEAGNGAPVALGSRRVAPFVPGEATGRVRVRAVFLTPAGANVVQESPVLDDLVLVTVPPGGPTVVEWRE